MISTTAELADACDAAREAGRVGIDTEFVWDKTYYATLGVVQIGYPDETCRLVDAPAIEDWTPFAGLMEDGSTVKVLHDAQQDLNILKRACGAAPCAVFDTQWASGFVGLSASISLSELLKVLLRVRLPKTETRSDWLKRPLSDKQLKYAEDDVRYSAALYDRILAMAEESGRADWVREEMLRYEEPELYEERDPETEMPRVRGSGALSHQERDILRALGAWRERNARRRNLPRSFILSDEGILSLVRNPPHSAAAIKVSKGLSKKVIDRHRDRLWAAIERGIAGDLPPLQEGPNRAPLPDDGYEARVDLALAFVKGSSLAAKIDPALIGNRADISQLVREGDDAQAADHRILRGWRAEFCGRRLLELLRGDGTLRVDADGFPRGE